jgi:hypothetical protein
MASLLDAALKVTGSGARFVWVSPEVIEAAGIQPWTELPVWVPPGGEYDGLHDGNVSAALAAGLSCRPVAETIADTWAWIQAEGYPEGDTARLHGLDPEKERDVLRRLAQ